ncbi:DNA polymerase III subunit epsilon [Actinomyces sp. zg-332]|uniref:exonuclease domain-containing protein n=1 Tax=Actinomyces sp. zg-332 TaxID=2708340 RepID=UPI001422979E|nr:exonuclease domain-containing protein [Actinomyces sp. zg-332]QPK94388.1 DNA polymerase III subunit epsilon [Actinomyces sp. zg-332]
MLDKELFVGFDTETTGVNYYEDKIVTAALVFYDFSSKNAQRVHNWLADPGIEISPQASAVNGITTEYAREHGRPLNDVLLEIRDTLIAAIKDDIPIVIFNANFDLSILHNNLRSAGLETIEDILGEDVYNVLDPLVIDRAVDKYRRGKRTLESMMNFYGVTQRDALHDAQVDTEVMLEVLDKIFDKHPVLDTFSAEELHSWQKDAYKNWAEGYNSWLAKSGKPANVSGVWPVKM